MTPPQEERLRELMAKFRRWAKGGEEDCPIEGCWKDEGGGENHEHDCCCHIWDMAAEQLEQALSAAPAPSPLMKQLLKLKSACCDGQCEVPILIDALLAASPAEQPHDPLDQIDGHMQASLSRDPETQGERIKKLYKAAEHPAAPAPMGTFKCLHCGKDSPHQHLIDRKGNVHDG